MQLSGCMTAPTYTEKIIKSKQYVKTSHAQFPLHTIIYEEVNLARATNIKDMIVFTAKHYPIKRSLHLLLWNDQQKKSSIFHKDYCHIMSIKNEKQCISSLNNDYHDRFKGAFANYSFETQQNVIFGDKLFWNRGISKDPNDDQHHAYLQITAHEYFHTYQNSTAYYHSSKKKMIKPKRSLCQQQKQDENQCIRYLGPMWLTEGAAELVGILMATKYKRMVFAEVLSRFLIEHKVTGDLLQKKGQSINLKNLTTLHDIRHIQKKHLISPHYSYGAWAVLYLISLQGHEKVLVDYYKDIAALHQSSGEPGWQASFLRNMGMPIETFYKKFANFLSQSHQEKMLLANKFWARYQQSRVN